MGPVEHIENIFLWVTIAFKFIAPFTGLLVLIYLGFLRPLTISRRKYSEKAQKIYFNSRVYFKRFDYLKQKRGIGLFKNAYWFNHADIYLVESSIIVFSSHIVLGKKFNKYSFKIDLDKNKQLPDSNIMNVDCLSIKVNNGDLEIEFNDPNYKNSIGFVIKKIGQDILENIK